MAPLGDAHNFGKAVRSFLSDSGPIIEKPRTVFWELLCFGSDSPIKTLLAGDHELALTHFQIDGRIITSWSGQVSTLDRTAGLLKAELLEQFGELLAYAFSFGITDLHHENILVTSRGLAAIDVECVGVLMKVPDQTGLIARRSNQSVSESALSALVSAEGALSEDQFTRLVCGYTRMLAGLRSKIDQIRHVVLTDIASQPEPPPIRIILRPTKVYKEAFATPDASEHFLPSEVEQMKRGDIPYYFKLKSTGPLLYWSEPNRTSIESDPRATTLADDHQDFDQLLTDDRLGNYLLPTGLLFLMRHNLEQTWRGTIDVGGVQLSASPNALSVTVCGQSFSAAR